MSKSTASIDTAVVLLTLAGLVLALQMTIFPLERLWKFQPLLVAVIGIAPLSLMVAATAQLLHAWQLQIRLPLPVAVVLVASLVIPLPWPASWPIGVRLVITVIGWGGVLLYVLWRETK